MGNGGSRTVTTTDIKNEIDIAVSIETKNITNVLNENISKVTSEIINENNTVIEAANSVTNNAKVKGVRIGGDNNTFNINQVAAIDAINKAVVDLISSTDQMGSLAADMTTEILGKVKNDAALAASLDVATKLNNVKSDAGGLASIARDVNAMLAQMAGPVSESERTTITNSVKQSFSSSSYNENNISNKISNDISTKIKNVNTQKCNSIGQAMNTFDGEDIIIQGNNNTFDLTQVSSIAVLNECIISALGTTKIATDITAVAGSDVKTDTYNSAAFDAAMKAANDLAKEDTLDDGIGDTIQGVAGTVGDTVTGVADTAGKTVTDVADTAGETVTGVASTIGSTLSSITQSFAGAGIMWILLMMCCLCAPCILCAIFVMFSRSSGSSNMDSSDMSSSSDLGDMETSSGE